MKFNSQICTTKEQSERLRALGLKKETADICIRSDNTLIIIRENSYIYNNLENAIQAGYCPAWSLHRLIELCATSKAPLIRVMFQNTYDEIISLIAEVIKFNAFNKEFLEE